MATVILLATFAFFLAFRVPIAFSIGLASLIYIIAFLPGVPLATAAQQMYAGADSFTLTAIPFFVLVGELMNAGGISKRLVDFAHKLVGHLTGGMGIVELLSSMIFAAISGSAVANAAGTGAITIPAMIRSRYPRGLAAAVESSSSSLGAVIPPSIPMIVYGSIAGVSVAGLFVAGYVPGILFALGLMLVIRISAKRLGVATDPRASFKDVVHYGKDALPALLAPAIIMGGILGGIMTPTEAGAVAAVYSLLVAVFVYREIRLDDLPRVLVNTGVTTGVVMLVMTIAAIFGWIMAYESIPANVAQALTAAITEPWVFMLAVVALLMIVGTFLDTIAALIILTPVLTPVAVAMGIDPLFFGLIVCISLTLGVLTPPVGTVLFVTASIAKTTLEDVARSVMPFFLVLAGGTFLLALLPQVVLWLPHLLGYK
jgi:tripartite ATP-independent transporter DctM subunit